jgi:hypothetical protein
VELHVHFPMRGHGVVEHLKKAQFMLVMSVVQLQYIEDVLLNVGPTTVPNCREMRLSQRRPQLLHDAVGSSELRGTSDIILSHERYKGTKWLMAEYRVMCRYERVALYETRRKGQVAPKNDFRPVIQG